MTTPLEQLVAELNDRRQDLVIKWTGVARQLNMSVQHLLRIRRGDVPITEDVAIAMDKFLGKDRGYTWNIIGTTAAQPSNPEIAELTDEQILALDFDAIGAHAARLHVREGRPAAIAFLRRATDLLSAVAELPSSGH